jgi:hypothetical protein
MESTASTNSGPTHEIDSKNKVKVDAWNCQKQYVMAYPLIFNENRVTVVKIINEY